MVEGAKGPFKMGLLVLYIFEFELLWPIQNTVVQSIELQGNKGCTDKSHQNNQGTGIAKWAGPGAASLIDASPSLPGVYSIR